VNSAAAQFSRGRRVLHQGHTLIFWITTASREADIAATALVTGSLHFLAAQACSPEAEAPRSRRSLPQATCSHESGVASALIVAPEDNAAVVGHGRAVAAMQSISMSNCPGQAGTATKMRAGGAVVK
jgi:hypothetical protein